MASLAGCDGPSSGSANENGTNTPAGEGGQPQRIRLAAEAEAWFGVEPEGIREQENPGLVFSPGMPYEIVWENRDGEEHELMIVDGNGEVVAASESSASEGETRSVEFTATEEMEEYYCEYHPDSMRGDIQVIADSEPTPGEE